MNPESSSSYKCSSCSFLTSAKIDFIKHSFSSHSSERSFKLMCGIDGCLHMFKHGSTFSSFKTHASRKHTDWRNRLLIPAPVHVVHTMTSNDNSQLTEASSSSEDSTEVCHHVTSTPPSLMPVEHTESECRSLIPEENAALFLLSFKERFKLPQKALDFAIGSITSISEDLCDSVKTAMKVRLQEKGSSFSNSDIDECCTYTDIFEGMMTEHLQSKFYKEHFGLVVR